MYTFVIRKNQTVTGPTFEPEGQSVYKCVFSTYYVSDTVLSIVLKEAYSFFWLE